MERVCALPYILLPVTCALAAIRMDCHRGNTSNCQLFSKNIKLVLLTLKGGGKFEGIGVSKKKRILFIARTLLDNTTKKCEQVYIGPILIYYYCLTKNCREKEKRRLVFVSDLYFSTEVTMKQSNMFSVCFVRLVRR